jgi:hypothetical protein
MARRQTPSGASTRAGVSPGDLREPAEKPSLASGHRTISAKLK